MADKVSVLKRGQWWHWWCPCCMGGNWRDTQREAFAEATRHVEQLAHVVDTDAALLTTDEQRAMDLTVELVNLFAQRIVLSGASREGDMWEFVLHVHSIQHTIMAQAAARAYPDRFRLLGGIVE